MACFGRTAQPRVGQGTARTWRRALRHGVLMLLAAAVLAPRAAAQTAPSVPSPAPAESTTPAESKRLAETPPPNREAATHAAPRGHALQNIVSVAPGATCLDRDRLIDRVARWLQRTTIEAPLRVVVRGDLQLPTRVFFSVVREPGDSAERRLDNAPSDCDQMHSAVALSIALAIEATLQHQPTAAGEIPPERVKGPGWQRPPPVRHPHLELAVLGGASVGVLTAPALGGSSRLSISPLSWLEISIAGLATHVTGENIDQIAGSFAETVLAAGLDACFGGETVQGVGFFMCVGGRGGTFRSAGDGFNMRNHTRTSEWWALAGSGQGRFWISGGVGVATSVEALYSLVPRDLSVLGVEGAPDYVRHVPRLGLSVTVGPVFRFF
jgi:hypothetical protein